MTALNAAARAALRDAGVTQYEWAREWFPCNGNPGDLRTEIGKPVWLGDACGCSDDRCMGYHHDRHEECGCLPVLLTGYLAARSRRTSEELAWYRNCLAELEEAAGRPLSAIVASYRRVQSRYQTPGDQAVSAPDAALPRPRLVVAVDDAGTRVAIGPVITDRSIDELRRQVDEFGWDVAEVIPHLSRANFIAARPRGEGTVHP